MGGVRFELALQSHVCVPAKLENFVRSQIINEIDQEEPELLRMQVAQSFFFSGESPVVLFEHHALQFRSCC